MPSGSTRGSSPSEGLRMCVLTQARGQVLAERVGGGSLCCGLSLSSLSLSSHFVLLNIVAFA